MIVDSLKCFPFVVTLSQLVSFSNSPLLSCSRTLLNSYANKCLFFLNTLTPQNTLELGSSMWLAAQTHREHWGAVRGRLGWINTKTDSYPDVVHQFRWLFMTMYSSLLKVLKRPQRTTFMKKSKGIQKNTLLCSTQGELSSTEPISQSQSSSPLSGIGVDGEPWL